MPHWLTVTLRWAVAAGVAVWAFVVLGPMVVDELASAIGFGRGAEELPDVETAMGPPPLTAGHTAAVADAAASLGTVQIPTGATVSVGPGGVDTLLLGFEPLPGDPACLAGVALEIYLHESVETSVHTLPARIDDLVELSDGDGLPANYLLDRSNPAAAYTSGAPGWLRFDVRGPYQLAARAAADDAPVVFALRLPEGAEAGATTTFATVADRPARLRWAAIEGCEEPSGDADADPLGGDEGDDGDGDEAGGQ